MTKHDETVVERMRLANPAPHAMADELAELFSEIDERIGGAVGGADSYVGELRRSVGRTVWYRRPVFVAIAAALVVFAIMLPVVFLGGSDPEVAIDSVVSTTTPLAATTAAPGVPDTTHATTTTAEGVGLVATSLPAGLAMTWQRVPADVGLERAWMRAVTAGGPGLVAVGSTEQLAAAVWISEDGAEWQRIESPSFEVSESLLEGTSGHERFMSDVVGGPGGLVATGGQWLGDQTVEHDGGDAEANEVVVWHSPDGAEWTEVDGSAFAGGTVNSVAVGGPGYVAVGAVVEDGRPAVWVSVDGRVWERIEDESLVPGADYASAELKDVTAGGPGLVAVGCEIPQADDKYEIWAQWHPGIWVSVDGRAWERLPDDAVVDPEIELQRRGPIPAGIPTCFNSVVAGDDGLVALGIWGDRTWLSANGYEWTITQSFVPPWIGESPFLTSVATSGDRVVGAGVSPSIEHAGRGRISPPHYTSVTFLALETDTETWHRVDRLEAIGRTGMVPNVNWGYEPAGIVDDIVAFGDVFVAVGHNGFYGPDLNEELDRNHCGFGDEWTGSCRTDAAVWIGTWDNG